MLLAATLSAQQPESSEPKTTALRKGERAPFSGQLLPPETALTLSLGAQQCLDRSELDLAHQKRMCALDLAQRNAALGSDLRALEAKLEITTAILADVRKRSERPFWETPEFVWPTAIGGTAVVCLAVGFGAIWAVGQLRPVLPR